MSELSPYTAWCAKHDCTHGHCPLGCEHPQPGLYANAEQIICGCCFFHDGTVTLIEPCVPATCRDAR